MGSQNRQTGLSDYTTARYYHYKVGRQGVAIPVILLLSVYRKCSSFILYN